jgi:fibronectin-binding autotransporter adhesin
MAEYTTVSSGVTSSGLSAVAGDTIYVSFGGVTSNTVLNSGGFEVVSYGGQGSGTVVESGGTLIVIPGGTMIGTTVAAGGSVVSTGIFATQAGGAVTILPDNTSDFVVSSGAYAFVLAGGTAIQTTVTTGGAVLAEVGGVTSGTVLKESEELLFSGGTASSTVVSSGGYEFVYSSGFASNVVVSNGGEQNVMLGGIAISTMIDSGGVAGISSGGSAMGAVISSGGTIALDTSGTANGTVLRNGSYEINFGTTSGTIVDSAAREGVNWGGTAIDTLVSSGGFEVVSSGGSINGTTVDSGGYLLLLPGGSASNLNVLDGASIVSSGIVIYRGTTGVTLAGDNTTGTVVTGLGVEYVLASGYASSTTVSGGAEIVDSGGQVFGTQILASGVEYVGPGGSAVGLVIAGGEFVSSGGVTSLTVVTTGGNETVQGTVIDTSIDGGDEVVFLGGTATGVSVNADSFEIVSLGGTTISTTVNSAGYELVFEGGVAISTTVNGGGLTQIGSGGTASHAIVAGLGTLILSSGAVAANGIVFAGTGAALDIHGSAMPTTTISGFNETDEIRLPDIDYVAGGAATLNSGTDVLTVTDGGASYELHFAGDYDGASFTLAEAGSGSVVTVANVPCFAAGTLILTDCGEVPVQALTVGDHVTTEGGGSQPIVWIGFRRIDCGRHPQPVKILPVRVAANAFGPGLPARPLFLSPDHAIFAEGVLIPVKHLINDSSIQQIEAKAITYFHIELPRHNVILAEGLPTESYLNCGDRAAFANADEPRMLHPAFGAEFQDVALFAEALGYAPLRVTGPEVARVRDRLNGRCKVGGGAGACQAEGHGNPPIFRGSEK